MFHFGEIPLQQLQKLARRPALQDLGDEDPVRRQDILGEGISGFGEQHDLQMVGLGMAGGRGRHVAEHDIGKAVQAALQFVGRLVAHEIHLDEVGAGDGVDRQQVDADHLAAFADAIDRHLAPAAGRGAEIHHACAGLEEMKLVVELQQLERRARAIALLLCLGDIRIVELPLQPARRRDGALVGAFHPHGEAAAARPRHVALVPAAAARPPATAAAPLAHRCVPLRPRR